MLERWSSGSSSWGAANGCDCSSVSAASSQLLDAEADPSLRSLLGKTALEGLQATHGEARKQRFREQHEAWAHDQGHGAWWQRWTDAVGTDESRMEQQFDNEMEALRGAVNRQATNQGGMRAAQRAELQQLTNLRQQEVLQQRKQHQAEFQRRQQQRLACAEHAHDKTRTATQAAPWSHAMALVWKWGQLSQQAPPVQKLTLIIKATSEQPMKVAAHSSQVRAKSRGEPSVQPAE